ncbi:MAG: DUF1553 domain-containing protein, partial [Planctomycetales bacterium]|nr:DUF1553 domain-containing protein [Planctomycetales bacterium]
YNRLLQTSHEGGVQPKEYLAIYAADRVRNVSAVWMGATLGCTQCHDHKFDPFTSKDFYAMAAFFADVDEAQHFKIGSNALPTKRPPEIDVVPRWQRERSKLGDDLDNSTDEKQTDRVMVTVALNEPRTIRLLPRGNWLDESGPIIEPAIPAFLGNVRSNDETRPTRLDLARWLTTPERGGLMTARVFVNRLWYLFFGTGLSSSLADFGGQGDAPVHPELLDRLACEFVESGWDVKHMVKLIVSSRTYQQSSADSEVLRERDPYNRVYTRQSRYRLDAEMVRDNALSVSGLLINHVGGPSVKPYQPAGYYRHLNFPQREYKQDDDSRQWRRGLYVHWQRQFLHPMMKAFDAPSREECTVARPRSNNALAALTLLNDPTFVEAAREFARNTLSKSDSDDARIDLAFRLATSRKPTEHERTVLANLLQQNREYYRQHAEEAQELLSIGIAQSNMTDRDSAELASWTMVARAILNLTEVITRN